ncbi:hypothetical protein BC834DRAFT_589308 [Gloeopeniophorella convolvens]|nr:hypothetical protein BC834DRAFT_589308 [Gloeopeniophorella convolvens]
MVDEETAGPAKLFTSLIRGAGAQGRTALDTESISPVTIALSSLRGYEESDACMRLPTATGCGQCWSVCRERYVSAR